jgi:hypothetical protein
VENCDQEERRKLQTFRDKILPTLVSTAILAIAGGLVAIRDTVNQHDSDLKHLASLCNMLNARTADYNVTQHKVENLEELVRKCYADIDRLERR